MGVRYRSAIALATAIASGCAKFSGEEGADAGASADGGAGDGGMVVDASTDGDVVAPTGYAREVLADKPLLYWRLGELSGEFADLGKHGYAARPVQGVERGEPSLLDDDNPSVRLGPGSSVESLSADTPELRFGGDASFTIECWVKIAAVGTAQDLVVRGTSNIGIGLYLQPTGEVTVSRGNASQGVGHGGGALSQGKVYHLAATFDGSALRLYVDGKNGGPSDLTKTSIVMPDNTNYGVTLGRVADGPPSADAWIDEVAIYGKALSPERITAHARSRR